jgi:hypothetical protein
MAEPFFDQDAPEMASIYAVVPGADVNTFVDVASENCYLVCDITPSLSGNGEMKVEMVGLIHNLRLFAKWLDDIGYPSILWAV